MTRITFAAFAVVLATLLVPLGIGASWLSLRVDSTEAYVDTVAPLADDPDLREALGDEVATAANGTLQQYSPIGLPPGVKEAVRASTQQVVESDGFPEFWRNANADAHREFLAIVHERDQGVVADGWVFIDVGPLVDDVLADVATMLPVSVTLPPTRLFVPVVPESRLEQARGAYQVLDWMAVWIPLIWVGLVALAVLLAPGWRGRLRTGAACAIGAALGGIAVLLLTGPATDVAVDQVDPAKQDLARLVIEVVVATLDDAARGVMILGLVAGVGLLAGSFLPGRRRPAPTY